ncbi:MULTISPECIES: hypothetical protein [unclassified Rhodococcus (in: high G+C Gram-positive bacteria)]|uniref:hypothetical protein n=1 Tax=unclassified Rhodococcus (in: high G+C Gram-positive bacteria) TaxID=192944 RepID=UPI00163A9045|nr:MULTISPECIES: hypothetical protein [unclassified Rhodococcus (in: high G+C Gram-positive bacteria)]MBC2637520.1 hypothetical protein [Rhodococcus sp. 3A]MBC2898389.1 hypothetical protein [Rhodococcus sp. 4CII]
MSEIRVDLDTATRDELVASFRSRLHAVNTLAEEAKRAERRSAVTRVRFGLGHTGTPEIGAPRRTYGW